MASRWNPRRPRNFNFSLRTGPSPSNGRNVRSNYNSYSRQNYYSRRNNYNYCNGNNNGYALQQNQSRVAQNYNNHNDNSYLSSPRQINEYNNNSSLHTDGYDGQYNNNGYGPPRENNGLYNPSGQNSEEMMIQDNFSVHNDNNNSNANNLTQQFSLQHFDPDLPSLRYQNVSSTNKNAIMFSQIYNNSKWDVDLN